MRCALLVACVLALAGCGGTTEEAGEQTTIEPPAERTTDLPAPPASPSLEETAQLGSKDCAEVVALYVEALRARRYDLAARVWNDPAIDAARLQAVFGGYGEPQLEPTEPAVEGAAGSLYCTVGGKLTDAQDPSKPPMEGTLLLRRVNDVPGATPDQLRWTLRSSTFVERLERSDGSEP